MALLIPDVGEVLLLKSLLYPTSGENWTLKLFSNNITPAESDTAGTYTEATFTGYSAATLTRTQAAGTWAVPTTTGGVSSSTYQTNAVFNPTSSQTIYGYFVVGAVSTTLVFAEAFASSKALSSGDTLTITPKFALD